MDAPTQPENNKNFKKPAKLEKVFVKIKCPDCGNEQITYIRGSVHVRCNVCGNTLAEPTGGKYRIKGKISEVLESNTPP